ncbi:hypothetical protein [Cypionkella sp.]|uniref:hypothetical protein n=1 Tax=Cypionkella sp. TaxID=2811411 RepID=UPI002ABA0827|nr:hypothetical protein [Cypionkella sp.]MDZ4393901.1 hypothetical protein [Cypionkella sp.]
MTLHPLLIAALLLPLPALAQTGPDLWGLGDAPAPQVSGQTPSLGAAPSAKTMVALTVQLETFRSAGYALPENLDLASYSEATLSAALSRSKVSASGCAAAVDLALFLDAHRAETSWLETLNAIDNPAELFKKSLRKIYIADGLGDGATGFIAQKVPGMSIVDGFLKVHETLPIINDHNIGSIAAREAIWTQEIFEASQAAAWDEAKIKANQVTLLGYANDSATKLAALATQMEAREQEVEDNHRTQMSLLESERDMAFRDADSTSSGQANAEKKANAELVFTAGTLALLKKREKALFAMLESYESAVLAEELRAAKAQVQYAALGKYARPIAQGKCDGIEKQGLLAASETAPAARTPQEGILGEILALPHDKLLITLNTLGVAPSDEFYNCLCQAGNYGSSGTQQYYHPDTVGTYDERYSCQTPGDPCIVSGYGCMRYPLPSDPALWKGCAAVGAEDPAQSILSAMAERPAKSTAKPEGTKP